MALLYHAEAEWAGECELFRLPLKAMAERQIDCDVVSIDSLLDPALTRVGKGSFTVNHESFRCMVVPYAQRIPRRLLDVLNSAGSRAGPCGLHERSPLGRQ